MNEFNDLKNVNKQMLSKLSLIADVITMVHELRDEVHQLKITNKHLHAENTALKEDLSTFKNVNTTMTPAPMPNTSTPPLTVPNMAPRKNSSSFSNVPL